MKKQLIIFDMDGTLINSGNVITNTINFVRKNIGLPLMKKDILLSQLNNPDINAADYFYGTSEFTDEQTKLFSEYYDKNCITDITLYDGIEDMLNHISKYFTITIATNASVEFATKMVEHLKIDHHFSMIVGSNSVKNPKPHPDMLLKIMNKFNILNQDAILIGDSLKDKNAAYKAKIDCILVDWGFTTFENEDTITNTKTLTNELLKFK